MHVLLERWGYDQEPLITMHASFFYHHGFNTFRVIIILKRFWSAEVRQRVNKTYGFFAYGLTTTAAAAYAATRGTAIMRFMTTRPYAVSS